MLDLYGVMIGSKSHIPPIDSNSLAIDPLTAVSGQKRHYRCYVLRLPQPAEGALVHRLLYHLLRFPLEEHIRRHRPRRHAIRSYPRPLQLFPQNLHHGLHRRFRRCVRSESGSQRHRHRGSEADDSPAAAALDPGGGFLATDERAARVDAEGPIEIFDRRVEDGWVLGVQHAGGIDQDVDLRIELRLGHVE
ncbi:unnamed protein product [Cuscuta epithymum]|uniref:Uncharacterized protein n=1 Tax=Cuscuta epithymum TaxID=186058 RepID=A0AAV0EW54_9ASTE|nr:unnamed protein product [Cuscuta epithymum]